MQLEVEQKMGKANPGKEVEWERERGVRALRLSHESEFNQTRSIIVFKMRSIGNFCGWFFSLALSHSLSVCLSVCMCMRAYARVVQINTES